MGGMQPHVLRVLANVSIIFEMLWSSGVAPEVGKKANVCAVFKKCKKDDPETAGWSDSSWTTGWWWSQPSWKPFPNTVRKKRWSGIVNRDFWRGNHAWPISWPYTAKSLVQLTAGEHWILYTSTLVKLSTLLIDKLMKYELDKQTGKWT